MRSLIVSMYIVAVIFALSGRDMFLSVGFFVAAVLLTLKHRHNNSVFNYRPHWTDAFSPRCVAAFLMAMFFLSMTAYFYNYRYFGYGMKADDFPNTWAYILDILTFDYPNELKNGCFMSKTFSIIAGGLSVIFAVLDKRSISEKKKLDLIIETEEYSEPIEE